MEVIIEIIIKDFLIDFLGINTRYYFFRIFKKENLSVNQNDIVSGFAQGFYNLFVGIFVFSLLVALMVYLLHVFGLL